MTRIAKDWNFGRNRGGKNVNIPVKNWANYAPLPRRRISVNRIDERWIIIKMDPEDERFIHSSIIIKIDPEDERFIHRSILQTMSGIQGNSTCQQSCVDNLFVWWGLFIHGLAWWPGTAGSLAVGRLKKELFIVSTLLAFSGHLKDPVE
jgi:hypothetical protein